MAVIKTVTNGDHTATFKAVSLSHAVAIFFGLASIIGAQQTWLWSAAHERELLARNVALDVDKKIDNAVGADKALVALRLTTLDAEVRALQERMAIAERQININTGKLEQGAAWRSR